MSFVTVKHTRPDTEALESLTIAESGKGFYAATLCEVSKDSSAVRTQTIVIPEEKLRNFIQGLLGMFGG